MGFLETLMGTMTGLGDRDLASDMLKDSKFTIISLAKAVTEVANPQLKALMVTHLMTAIQQHHQLSDLAASRDWYKPMLPPQQQVDTDVNLARNLI